MRDRLRPQDSRRVLRKTTTARRSPCRRYPMHTDFERVGESSVSHLGAEDTTTPIRYFLRPTEQNREAHTRQDAADSHGHTPCLRGMGQCGYSVQSVRAKLRRWNEVVSIRCTPLGRWKESAGRRSFGDALSWLRRRTRAVARVRRDMRDATRTRCQNRSKASRRLSCKVGSVDPPGVLGDVYHPGRIGPFRCAAQSLTVGMPVSP